MLYESEDRAKQARNHRVSQVTSIHDVADTCLNPGPSPFLENIKRRNHTQGLCEGVVREEQAIHNAGISFSLSFLTGFQTNKFRSPVVCWGTGTFALLNEKLKSKQTGPATELDGGDEGLPGKILHQSQINGFPLVH